MKNLTKGILTIAVITATTFCTVFAAAYTKFSSKFIRHIKDCDNYTETIQSEFEGRTFTTTRHIIGWRNGFCRYEETITSPVDSYKLDCNFSDIQLDELYSAMKSKSNQPEVYELETFGEKLDEKTGHITFVNVGTRQIKGNKAYIAWAKYQNNPYFCRPKKIK